MRASKRLLATLLVLNLILGYMTFTLQDVYAAISPINIYIKNLTDGSLTFGWDRPNSAKSFRISYHTPQSGLQTIVSNEDINTYTLEEMQNDYIYDIRVEVFNNTDLGGTKIAEGLVYFLPGITFYADGAEQEREALPGGGYEIGEKPRLNIKWVMPKVWNEALGEFRYASGADSISIISNGLNSVYNNNVEITSLNFKINISSSFSTLNSGSNQSSINVDYNNSEYKAHVSGNPAVTSRISGPDANGYMYFDLIGRKDLNTPLPAAEEYGLPDGDILPGSVYYMNIKLAYKNDAGDSKYAVTVGKPSDLNGSLLAGPFIYTYTPIRFQLSKDSSDNIYIKVYKTNQGSLDLPRMFYEIQSSDDPTIPGDWAVRKTIDDSFFAPGVESAITMISGVGVNNKIYYKIVVKTDTTSDRINSMPMYYILSEDISKSPVPKGIIVIDRKLVTRIITENGEDKVQKSSDITISWEKPANWDEIRANEEPDKDVVFHILLNVNETETQMETFPELKADGILLGYFPLKYRKVLYFSSKSVKENGNRLEYTINGFDLFKGSYFSGMDASGEVSLIEETIDNPENYPAFLLPNKVYYMQMYTTSAPNRNSTELEDMSDKSIIVSFTTRAVKEVDVPLPKDLRLNVNDADVTIGETTVISNYIELQFDKVNIDWSNYTSDADAAKNTYYDIYASTRSDINSFRLVGSTEFQHGDLTFIGDDDDQSTSIRVTVRNFSEGTPAYSVFGTGLRPNTTYYFIAKTRLVIGGKSSESEPTVLLPVTTVRGIIGAPDDSSKKPLAPSDFGIAQDKDGNDLISSSSVVFSWTRLETDVVYNIICTSRRLGADEGSYTGQDDALYQGFLTEFGEIVLDPSLGNLPDNFQYDPVSKELRFTVNRWLFPNKLYYFSIKAVNKTDKTSVSSWVSIPVTTTLIKQPAFLEVVKDVQLGFFFNDEDLKTRTEDYSIYLKAEDDLKFRYITKDKYMISRFGSTFYIRMVNLKPNTSYDVKVYKNNDETLVHSKEGMETRDSYHQLEVRWRGIPGYKFELTLRTDSDDNYIMLKDEDLEQYIDENGRRVPYYPEKNSETSGTDYVYYYARIKSIPVKTDDGSLIHVDLKSNTKYYIKVRAARTDPVDPAIVSYSKYVGPVDMRTDFNQMDYEDEDGVIRKEASFYDKIAEFEEKMFWRMDMKNASRNKLLLKSDRVVDAIINNGPYTYTLDISNYAQSVSEDIIYIPASVFEALETVNKSFAIRTWGAEYVFRPGTVDLESEEISKLKEDKNVNDIFYRIKTSRKDDSEESLPRELKPLSKVNEFEMEVLGTSLRYQQLKEQVKDLLYNKESGLMQQKLNEFLEETSDSTQKSSEIEEILEDMIYDIELELSDFLKNRFEGKNGSRPIIVKTQTVSAFGSPMLTKLAFKAEAGLNLPYVCYDGTETWKKLSTDIAYVADKIAFNVFKTGEFTVLNLKVVSEDITGDSSLSQAINLLMSKYDLTEVFGTMKSFYPEDSVKVKEIILLYEKVTGREAEATGLTINQKARKYGLESLIGLGGVLRDVTRQEAAIVVMLVYSFKTGVDVEKYVPNKYFHIKDDASIGDSSYSYVLMAVDLGILGLEEENSFLPDTSIKRAELAQAFVKLLKLTGDI
ncbi:MAG: ferrous iron transporter A [Clostridiaceae bacterium]|nr:ferrous iron transporter A [Clostridiaceae bacterium]